MAFSAKHQESIANGTASKTVWKDGEPKHLEPVIFYAHGVVFSGVYNAEIKMFSGTATKMDEFNTQLIAVTRLIAAKEVGGWFSTPDIKKL